MNLREIDRLVAEKVMGWEAGKYAYGSWFPTTNIADAWKVVEKLSKDGFEFQVWREKNGKYNVEFAKDFFYVFGFAESETAPLAICLAALKAVGVEVEVNEQ
jgi:Phage ABA sandwich domain